MVDADDVNNGINPFVDQEDPDMLCMIRRNRSFFGELFHSSLTRKKAAHSKLPLLILDDRIADE